MFASSSGSMQWLAQQLPLVRVRRHQGINAARSVVVDARQISNLYRAIFDNVPDAEMQNILKDVQRVVRRRKVLVPSVNSNIMMAQPALLNIDIVGVRNFRTRAAASGISSRKQDELEPTPIKKLFDGLFGKQDTKKPDKSDQEKLAAFRDELHKVPEQQKKPFLDGFSQAMLLSKSSTTPVQPNKRSSILTRIYVVIIIAILISLMTGGDRPIASFIFSNAQEVRPEEVTVSFDDVRGMDEAKQEVEEIVSYLRDPDKYNRLGGRLPKGVLMVGPPGTGKTLLARAIAGEAQVPFFHTSGSEFDEVLVGQGARRVRDLFERAKARSPCIVFIDEIDSVGSKRVSNSLHPYANQTINQLLSEMDGFNRNEGIIVIGATNRLEDLDKALLRPGRFDVRVNVSKPDMDGRKDIFKLYLGHIIHEKVNVNVLAKGTTGFTGADIENMVNQAALKAASEGCNRVAMRHLDEAKDRVLMGPARIKGRFPDEETNKCTAFHEAGHTLVALYTKNATPVHKVTIIPRGGSMGHTALLPDKDEYQINRSQLLAQLDVMMGGRVAEELIFGDDRVTTGAADDLKRATSLASQMVKHFGFSDKLGLRDFTVDEETSALIQVNERSPQTNELIDQEIGRLLKESYVRAKKILTEKAREHHLLAEALLLHETLSADEVRTLLETGHFERPNLSGALAGAEIVPARAEKKKKHKTPMVHINMDVD